MKTSGEKRAVGITAVVIAGLLGGCNYPVDKEARENLLKNLGNTTVTVFPAFVRQGSEGSYDVAAAETVGQFLIDEGLAQATVGQAEVPITGPWHMNQAKMLRESAEAFSLYVIAHPVETEFALLPEFLYGGRGTVGGIHCYVADAQGRVALVILQNSHWDEFKAVDPKTNEDCAEVLIRALRDYLKASDDE